MQVQIDIGFDQLVQIIKTLPVSQLNKLKAEIEHSTKVEDINADLEALLLAGPVATKRSMRIGSCLWLSRLLQPMN